MDSGLSRRSISSFHRWVAVIITVEAAIHVLGHILLAAFDGSVSDAMSNLKLAVGFDHGMGTLVS